MAEKWLEKSSKKLRFFAKAEVAAVFARTMKGLYRFPESNLAEKSALETYITCSKAAYYWRQELRLLVSVQPGDTNLAQSNCIDKQ
ncbi:MAG: hypothetical protein WA672_09985 [Candidatus Angelobacter sp.]